MMVRCEVTEELVLINLELDPVQYLHLLRIRSKKTSCKFERFLQTPLFYQ